MITFDEARGDAPVVVESEGIDVELSVVGGESDGMPWGPDTVAVRALEDGRPMGFVDRDTDHFTAYVFPSTDGFVHASFPDAVGFIVATVTADS